MPAETVISAVNINDPDALRRVLQESGVTDASKADRIASATRRTITERMEEDPTFYKRFSELLKQTILDYREMRLSEREYLNHVMDIAGKMARKERGDGIPESIRGNDDAVAFFGVLDGVLKGAGGINVVKEDTAGIAGALIDIVKAHRIVGVWSNEVAQNNMRNAIDDYFFDVLRDQKGVTVPVALLDELEKRLMQVAQARFHD
jgi:type I restriction enzyme R subunit